MPHWRVALDRDSPSHDLWGLHIAKVAVIAIQTIGPIPGRAWGKSERIHPKSATRRGFGPLLPVRPPKLKMSSPISAALNQQVDAMPTARIGRPAPAMEPEASTECRFRCNCGDTGEAAHS